VLQPSIDLGSIELTIGQIPRPGQWNNLGIGGLELLKFRFSVLLSQRLQIGKL